MSFFTMKPEIQGTFGVVTSTHWIASDVGMRMLELGGNAFDAAIAAGLVLQVVEPHLNDPVGDLPMVLHNAKTGKTEVICGQGPAPAGATIEHYRGEDLSLIPGDGFLATVIPGSFDAWMLMLRDYGSLPLRTVMEPAIYYAEAGHPILSRVTATIAGLADFFRDEWPISHATWLPGGKVPEARSLFHNPVLAQTWTRFLAEAETRQGREAQIEGARYCFYRGFIAESIVAFLKDAEVRDGSGEKHKGVLSVETPLAYDYHDWTITKIGPWGQGPVLLQSLALLKGFDIGKLDPTGSDFVHVVTEAMKFAYADREAYYGDPAFIEVPMEHLL